MASTSSSSSSTSRRSRRSEVLASSPQPTPLVALAGSGSGSPNNLTPTPDSKDSDGELLSEAFTHKVSLDGAPPTSPPLEGATGDSPPLCSNKRELSAPAFAAARTSSLGPLEEGGELSRFNSVEMLQQQQRVAPPPGKKSNGGATPAGIRALKGLSEAPASMYQFGSKSFADPMVVGRADSGGALPPRSKALVIYPPACLKHETMNHQENKDRLSVLCGPQGVLRRGPFAGLDWADGDSVVPACLADLLRVHEVDYVRHLQRLCRALPGDAASSLLEGLPLAMQGNAPPGSGPPPELQPLTVGGGSEEGMTVVDAEGGDGDLAYASGANARVMPTLAHNTSIRIFPVNGLGDDDRSDSDSDSTGKRGAAAEAPGARGTLAAAAESQFLDTDTRISRESFEVARIAAGAVIQAVDMVASGRYSRVFVASRPPGHHAGPRGAVPSHSFWKAPSMCSSGFCLLNNVAIGAAYARQVHGRPPAGRFQRVAIVDVDIHHGNGTEEIVRALKPCKRALPLPASWAPMEYELYKPWLNEDDPDHIFFGSINLVDGLYFYPCSGRAVENDFKNHPNIVNVELTPVRNPPASASAAVVGKPRTAVNLSEKKMKENCAKASTEFREKVGSELLPRLRAFRPDLIFISAGFDGHMLDLYHYYTDEDFAWVTRELVAIAEANRGGVISVLEGGYHLRPDPKVKPRGPSARTAKGRSNANSAPQQLSSSASDGSGGSAGTGGGSSVLPPSDDEDAAGGGGVNPDTDGGLARGVMAHVLELLR